jgi:hypothetical protein
VPSFTKTSSPELDEIFSAFRSKVFLPSLLPKEQRDLVFKARHKRILAAEPTFATIGGEEFQLEHIDRGKDIPGTREGLGKVLELMKDKTDWDNLPRFLEGLYASGRRLKPTWPASILKKAAEAGRLDVFLECARRVSNTGFALNDPGLVARIVWQIQYRAMTGDWNAKLINQGIAWVEMVSIMLEDKRHAGGRIIRKDDPRTSPQLIGALLELSAVRAARQLDGKDEDGKVAQYAQRLLELDQGLEPPAKAENTRSEIHRANRWLCGVVPLAHGIKVAQTVLGPTSELAVKLQTKLSALENLISQQREIVLKSTSTIEYRGLEMYDKLLGEGSA